MLRSRTIQDIWHSPRTQSHRSVKEVLYPGLVHRLHVSNLQQKRYDQRSRSSTKCAALTPSHEDLSEVLDKHLVSYFRERSTFRDNLSAKESLHASGTLRISTLRSIDLPGKSTMTVKYKPASRRICPLRWSSSYQYIVAFFLNGIQQTDRAGYHQTWSQNFGETIARLLHTGIKYQIDPTLPTESSLTIACKIAEWGNLGSLGDKRMDARNDGRWRTLEPQGSQRKKMSTLTNTLTKQYNPSPHGRLTNGSTYGD